MNQSSVLLGIAVGIGATIPTAIEKIPDPTVKPLVQIIALLLVLWLAAKVDLQKVSDNIKDSIRPPKT